MVSEQVIIITILILIIFYFILVIEDSNRIDTQRLNYLRSATQNPTRSSLEKMDKKGIIVEVVDEIIKEE